ncbi:MAG: EF-P lysine aminoacylase GenX [Gammaproteobacteria bacterium]|nr:EF-P lysine aminoacylase GenX [Gammaproteobacteria bacterium]
MSPGPKRSRSAAVSVQDDVNWRPAASRQMLQARADLLNRIRGWFCELGVMEVETPILSESGTPDPALESFQTDYEGLGISGPRYLHTSPEFFMKRLLSAGSGPIYQIARVFRNGESGGRHNPEFSLLEWYRPGYDHLQLMDEVAALVNLLLETPRSVEFMSYSEAFQHHLGIDPLSSSLFELKSAAVELGIGGAAELNLPERDGWLDLLLSHGVEPHLGQGTLCFLYDYPASQGALARISPKNPLVAERFELYMEGLELANGFNELGDCQEQRSRFEQEQARRHQLGLPEIPIDSRFLAGLSQGFPDCAGVALGLDRLLMVLTGAESIGQVLAFPFSRA